MKLIELRPPRIAMVLTGFAALMSRLIGSGVRLSVPWLGVVLGVTGLVVMLWPWTPTVSPSKPIRRRPYLIFPFGTSRRVVFGQLLHAADLPWCPYWRKTKQYMKSPPLIHGVLGPGGSVSPGLRRRSSTPRGRGRRGTPSARGALRAPA